jgi:hypothetical protein
MQEASSAHLGAHHMSERTVELHLENAPSEHTKHLSTAELLIQSRVRKDVEAHMHSADFLAEYEATRPKPVGSCAGCIRVIDTVYAITQHLAFENLFYCIIITQCVHSSMSTYAGISGSSYMAALDWALGTSFFFESALKIVAEGARPWKFFYGNPQSRWNCFDFTSKLAVFQLYHF